MNALSCREPAFGVLAVDGLGATTLPNFSSSFRTCDTRSAMNRMLASNFAEVGSILEGSRVEVAFDSET
jgi:hypothetical protein